MMQSSVRIENAPSSHGQPQNGQSHFEPELPIMPLKVTAQTSLNDIITLMNQNRQTYSDLSCALSPISTFSPSSLESLQPPSLRLSDVIVLDNGKPVGILTKREFVHLAVKEGLLAHHTAESVMTPFLVTINQEQATNICFVVNLFQQHSIRHLPIVDAQGKFVEVLTREEVIKKLHPSDLLRLQFVSENMICDVVQAAPTATLQTIAQLMTQYQVSCIVITELHTDKTYPLGIITEGDIVQYQYLQLDLTQLTAQTVMSYPAFCASLNTNLWQAQQVMAQHQITHLVITHVDGSLAGILTQKTLLKALNPTVMLEMVSRLQRQVVSLEIEKKHLLQARNDQLITAIDRKTADLEVQSKFDGLLAKINRRVNASLDLNQVLQAAVNSLQELLLVDRVMVYRFNADWSGQVVVESVSDARWSLLNQEYFDPCFQHKSAGRFLREPVKAITDIRDAGLQLCHVEFLETLGVRSNLVAAILSEDQLWGLLLLHHCQDTRDWTPREVDLLQEVGVQLAIALRQVSTHQKLQIELQGRLAAEQQNLKQLASIEAAVDGIAILEDQHYQYLNSAHAKMFGYLTADELMGKSWRQLYREEEIQLFEQEIFPALMHNRAWQGEINALRKDGSTFVEGLSLTMTEDNLLICVCRDISERKSAEAELQNLSTRLGLALQSGAIGTWEWDLLTHQLTWDNCMCNLYGIKPEAFSGLLSEWAAYLHPEDLEAVRKQIKRAICEQKELNIEYRIIQPNGQLRYINAKGRLHYNAEGTPLRMIGVNFDISDRKQAEADILKALKKEQELSEMKSRFVSNTSHEFRTPLAVIYNNAELLKLFGDKLSTEETQDCLDTILNYVEHTTELINEVLVFNKAEAGSITLNLQPFDVVGFSRRLCQEISMSAPTHHFDFVMQDDRPQRLRHSNIAQLDGKLLQQILTNLLTNASKYSPEGGKVTFQLKLLSHEIEFSITDEGIGIPEEDQTHLFEPFHRATNVGETPGTGLGLSIVDHLVSIHKGCIKVHSVPDEGSSFIVTIPPQGNSTDLWQPEKGSET